MEVKLLIIYFLQVIRTCVKVFIENKCNSNLQSDTFHKGWGTRFLED